MNPRFLAVAACAMAFAAHAAGDAAEPIDWKRANQEVGQFPRGHVDLLKWEQQQGAAAPLPAPAAGPVLDAEAAVRLAIENNPGLAASRATLEVRDAQRRQAGALPNPHLAFSKLREGDTREFERMLSFNVLQLFALPWRAQRAGERMELARLAAAQDVIRVAADTRKAWVQAVAAEQSLRYLRDARESAQAGADLARRMARVGNFSKLREAQERSLLLELDAQVARAEQAARSEREKLARLLGTAGAPAQFTLPERLPELPKDLPDQGAVEATALRERLDVRAAQDEARYLADALGLARVESVVDSAELGIVRNTSARGWEIGVTLPIFDGGSARRAEAHAAYAQATARAQEAALRARSEAREALGGWQTAYGLAKHYRDEIVPVRKFIADEMLLRYNGMLASVWDLLGETRNHVQAVRGAIDAQRDFWIADTDLRTALTGTSPGNLSAGAVGSAPAAATSSQGH